MKPKKGRGLSIFARTFLLLALALLVAQGIGIALLILRTPPYSPPVPLPEVVALLSSQMPNDNQRLRIRMAATPPTAPTGDYVDDPIARDALAAWLGTDAGQVRFYRYRGDGGPMDMRGLRREDRPPSATAAPAQARPGEDPAIAPPPPPETTGPRQTFHMRLRDDAAAYHMAERLRAAPLHFRLRDDFIAAARQADGRWRIVEYSGRGLSDRFKRQVLWLFAVGLLAVLAMAWWFSRALSAPIRRFAEAADQLGQNPEAPALERAGPPEIRQATDSFNAMQARINRLIRERTHMVGAIAHDLRTPLARLAFRLNGAPPELRDRAAADIEEMKAMISSALDFLRDGHRPGVRERLDFRLLVESVVDDLCDIGCEVTLAPGTAVTVIGDPLALRRMVVNLVENALKYGHRARLALSTAQGLCRLRIDDDGPGIDPTQREQLFMPFFRGEASRNRDTGGIGLGLSAAHGIALAHGGEIDLDNRPGGGLRVTVVLPCLSSPEDRAG